MGGFTMVELVIVVAVIAVIAAVALPNIAAFLRGYKLRGATQQFAGELQTARSKAITKNANERVILSIVDADSYRFYIQDDNPDDINPAPTVALGPLRDLPSGVVFVPAISNGVAFDRLGRACRLTPTSTTPPCDLMAAVAGGILCPVADQPACNNRGPGNYIGADPLNPADTLVRVREVRAGTGGMERTIRIAPGGRVRVQR